MESSARKLQIEQIDKKFARLQVFRDIQRPARGWIYALRKALNMSLSQLGRRLNKKGATVKEIEDRERDGSITLKKLIEVADALDLELVYGFLPKESSLAGMIERQAQQVARAIVMRTSQSMKLEEQENSEERLRQAIQERADQLVREMPRYLWD